MNALVPIHAAALTVTDVEKVANAIARGGLFGSKDPYAVLTLCLLAQAEGHHPAVVFRDYHIIQGKPAKKAEAMLRDFIQSGGKVEWHKLDDTCADATFTHPSGSARIEWTMERAKKAQLTTAMWGKYPRQMLRSRVISEGIRTVYPGATSGLYVPEEVSAFEASPTPAAEAPIDGGTLDSAPTPQGEEIPAKVVGIHKIKTAIRAMKAAGEGATNLEEFEAIVAGYGDEMTALETANHSWWTGEDGNGGFEGIPAWLARRRSELSDDGIVAELIRSMKGCDTRVALEGWMIANEELLSTLDGADSRRFQSAYDQFEAGLTLVDTVRA